MEELIINCETGERTRRKFTPAEVTQREAEIAEAELDNKKQERQEAKAQLIDATGRLEQAKALLDDGIDTADVAAIQKEVDDLKKQLKPIEPLET